MTSADLHGVNGSKFKDVTGILRFTVWKYTLRINLNVADDPYTIRFIVGVDHITFRTPILCRGFTQGLQFQI